MLVFEIYHGDLPDFLEKDLDVQLAYGNAGRGVGAADVGRGDPALPVRWRGQ